MPGGGPTGIRAVQKDGVDSRLKISAIRIRHADGDRAAVHGLPLDASDRTIGVWCDDDRGFGEESTESVCVVKGRHPGEQVPAAEVRPDLPVDRSLREFDRQMFEPPGERLAAGEPVDEGGPDPGVSGRAQNHPQSTGRRRGSEGPGNGDREMGAAIIAHSGGGKITKAFGRRDHGQARVPADRHHFRSASSLHDQWDLELIGESGGEGSARRAGGHDDIEFVHAGFRQGVQDRMDRSLSNPERDSGRDRDHRRRRVPVVGLVPGIAIQRQEGSNPFGGEAHRESREGGSLLMNASPIENEGGAEGHGPGLPLVPAAVTA